jgi:hypothetical protein
MHAANLLNKRRREERQREDHQKPAPERTTERDHRPAPRKTNSQTSFLDSIAGGVGTPTGTSAPTFPSALNRHTQSSLYSPPQAQGNGCGTGIPAEPIVLYHKQVRQRQAGTIQ